MQSDWTMRLEIAENRGGRRYVRAVNLDIEDFGERLAAEMEAGLAFVGPSAFDQTVRVLKERRFRREALLMAAQNLGKQMADELEDREGWNGEERQERLRGK